MGFDGLALRGTVYGCGLVVKVPVHGVEQLHGFLVSPDRVHAEREQRQAGEEEEARGQGHARTELSPVAPGKPPHVVGEDHAAVEHVDHHPLVGLPKETLGPAGLSRRRRERQ